MSDSPAVTALCGEPVTTATTKIPQETTMEVRGQDYSDGPTSMVYDSGAIFTMSSNGMVYCFDLDLYPVWSYQTGGKAYTYSPTVIDGYVITGMLDGHMYIFDETDGSLVADETVFTKYWSGATSTELYRMRIETIANDYSLSEVQWVGFTVTSKDLSVFVTAANAALAEKGIDIQLDASGNLTSTTYGTNLKMWYASGEWKAVTGSGDYTKSSVFSIEAGEKYRVDDLTSVPDEYKSAYTGPDGSGYYYRTPSIAYDYFNNIGGITQILAVRDGNDIKLFFGFNDGLGMSARTFGMAVYKLDPSTDTLTRPYYDNTAQVSSYMTPVTVNDTEYVYYMTSVSAVTTMMRMNVSTLEKETMAVGVYETHGALNLINGTYLAATTYNKNYPACMYTLDGTKVGECWIPEGSRGFCMNNIIFFDGGYMIGNDDYMLCFTGGFDTPIILKPTEDMNLSMLWIILGIAGGIVALVVITYLILRFVVGWEKPFSRLLAEYNKFLHGEEYTHNTLSRHKLWLVLSIGILLTTISVMLSLCLGPTQSLNPFEMLGALGSAIKKGGSNLTYDELMVYSARMPRTLVALAVGVGLSVAGCMYQAIIRNPMVDPYIMGVSSGAGTAAIAVIAFDFTFFGLFPPHSVFLTAAAAGVGGILAFFCTMLLAHKAGGTSINYVLAGVIVGLVFSAVQTLMLTFAGNNVTSALSWLYGSFSEVTWKKVWIVLVPAIGISLASLFWAKEFNLVLLGEDQAKQMGLNVRSFNRWMLIIASLLTAICVAFCGIIGFVGLVIPHLCRMVLGGDHRLVIPASMAFGGFLMVMADLASRMIIPGFELPVGAITTVIGVPVFAWLLIKRGKMYEG